MSKKIEDGGLTEQLEQEVHDAVAGKDKSDTITILISEYEFDYKAAEKYWKEYGGTKRTGFRATFYKQLEEQDLTSEDGKQF